MELCVIQRRCELQLLQQSKSTTEFANYAHRFQAAEQHLDLGFFDIIRERGVSQRKLWKIWIRIGMQLP